MKLKPIVDSLDGMPDALKEMYVASNGKYVLDLDGEPAGFVPKGKLDEFRNNNVELMKQLEQLKGKALTDEELAEFKKMREEQQKLKDKQLIDAGKIDELLEQRTSNMRGEYEGKITKLEELLEALSEKLIDAEEKLAGTLITSELSRAVSQVGHLRKGAMDDLVHRAQQVWTYDDGNIVAKNGDQVIFGKDGKSPLTILEWTQSLVESAPHLFEGSNGGGSSGNSGGGTGGVRTIARGDNKAFISNLKEVAEGKVAVQ